MEINSYHQNLYIIYIFITYDFMILFIYIFFYLFFLLKQQIIEVDGIIKSWSKAIRILKCILGFTKYRTGPKSGLCWKKRGRRSIHGKFEAISTILRSNRVRLVSFYNFCFHYRSKKNYFDYLKYKIYLASS